MELQSAGRTSTTQQPLLELDAPPAKRGRRTSSAETKTQPCGEGDICQDAPKTRQDFELDKLPENMLHHIHSLMPVLDAGRAACVSRQFLCSWRCYSNLTLNIQTLWSPGDKFEGSEMYFINKVDKILNNYSDNGMKVKTLKLNLWHCSSVSASYLDRWLRIAVKPGIKELRLLLSPSMKEKYCFPCSVLFDEAATSLIESLYISNCTFHPIGTLGCFRRLKSLVLCGVHITEEGLRQLVSKSFSLEWLEIFSCNEIICLKIPCTLQKLKLLKVGRCPKIQVIEISAPNLSAFHHYGFPPEIYIEDSSQLTEVYLSSLYPSGILSYSRAKLPSIASNVERLTLVFCGENVNTPMLHEKLHHLKSLEFEFHGSGACSPVYDIFSLVSFLDASPALESLILRVARNAIVDHCDAGDDVYLKGKSAYQHDRLKRVTITGFCSAKSLIKLVISILESAPSLERLTLDTTPRGCGRKLGDTSICTAAKYKSKCCWIGERSLEESNRAVEAAGRYIAGRIPSAVEFEVLEPCRRCHTGNPVDDVLNKS
ncbi:F-box protein At2g39490 isoform X1 [Triticum urartu]|uniref:F-box domain-containing protein n=1 Tax=Triticum urartu TaxID=4572 RepID=A0A8R7TNN7_TRIUA|nr:F-box protein At2g39490 isoform X1 [Triticum urartu]